jgi:glutamate racemase
LALKADAAMSAIGAIGVFDSGIGGLSILKCLREALPSEAFVYFADSAYNPYGDKSDAEVIARSFTVTEELIAKHQIKALVVACNTATAAAIHLLRARYPELAIVGIEPALKPAAAVTKTKRVAVLATRGTLASEKFLTLKASLTDQAVFTCIPCIGLANLIERYAAGEVEEAQVRAACAGFLADAGAFDTLVLGCTHYALVEPTFRALIGTDVAIVDNGAAVAKRLATLLKALQDTADEPIDDSITKSPRLQLTGSGSQTLLILAAQRWL